MTDENALPILVINCDKKPFAHNFKRGLGYGAKESIIIIIWGKGYYYNEVIVIISIVIIVIISMGYYPID